MMKANHLLLKRVSRRLGAAAAVALLTGCNSLLETETRFISSARVTIAGESPVPMILITSNNFTASPAQGGGLDVNYLLADTVEITLPFEQSYNFGRTDRFVVKLANKDSESTATVDLRVFLDGEQWDRAQGTMKDSSVELVFYQGF